MQVEQLTGRVFGRLEARAHVGSATGGSALWCCACSCGEFVVVPAVRLKTGKTRSCGCLRREIAAARLHRHGHGSNGDRRPRSSEYVIWRSMKARCTRTTHADYARYGGRGITVDPRWLGPDGFKNFLADMGRRPSLQHSIERKNNNEGYSKENCVWATRREQANNTRGNRRVTFNGRTQTVAEWARELRVPSRRLQARLSAGWSAARAFSEPPRRW